MVLRRLNRLEYQNTIQDLFGIEVDVEKYFPADDTGYGFDTIGEVLSLSPLLMEKYLSMAEIVMEKVLGPAENEESSKELHAQDFTGGYKHGEMKLLASKGSLTLFFSSPRDGEYEMNISATATRAGNELAKMLVGLNGNEIAKFSIDAEYPTTKPYTLKFIGKANFKMSLP